MNDYTELLVEEHAQSGLVLDAGLLLLLVIGNARRELVGSFKRLNAFVMEDYDALVAIASRFQKLTTTPNILTEVSNLADELTGNYKKDYLAAFATEIDFLDEQYVPSRDVLPSDFFALFGLSDAVIAEIASRGLLVITTDGRLYHYLAGIGLPVLNFNHIRTMHWS